MKNFDTDTLYNMDCIAGAKKFIKDKSVDLIITDPPYGIQADKLHRHYNRDEKHVMDGYTDIAQSEYPQFSIDWILQAERILRPGGSIYILSGYTNLIHILNALDRTALTVRNHIIWKYNFGVYTSKKYVSSHYHILYCVKPGGNVTFNTYVRYGPMEKNSSDRSLNYNDREDVWIISREYKPGQVKNKNELPMKLLIKILQYSSNEGDLVCDFFLGGFSTAKAALGLNRKITGFEINKNTFNHHKNEIKKLKPGYLLSSVRTGEQNHYSNQHKTWQESEIMRLQKRYKEIYNNLKNKRKTIEILQQEFQRGYFSIYNCLKRSQ